MSSRQFVELLWIPTLAALVGSAIVASIFFLFTNRWPSLGYWLAAVFAYFVVIVPAVIRSFKRM